MTTEPVHGRIHVVDPGYGLADLAMDLYALMTTALLLALGVLALRLAA